MLSVEQNSKVDNFEQNSKVDNFKQNSNKLNAIGRNYYNKKDYEQAVKYYLMAIELGNSNAMDNLGCYYYKRDKYSDAEKYYLMAVELGNLQAMRHLAEYYDVIEQDDEKVKKYYKMAIKLGDSIAMNDLAEYYYEKDKYKNAEKYYLMAIKLGNIEAMINLADLYYEKKLYKNAEKYYLMAIDLGNSRAMDTLAKYYENIEKNYQQAIRYYLMAIDFGNSDATDNLALYYENVEKNYQQAIKYYLMSNRKDFYQFIIKKIKEYSIDKIRLYKKNVDINIDELNKKIKLKILFNNKTYILDTIPDKLNVDKYKNFDFGTLIIKYFKSNGYFWIDYTVTDDFVKLFINDFYFSDTKKVDICLKLEEFIDPDDFLNVPSYCGQEHTRDIIIKQNIYICYLNRKLSKLTELVKDTKYY
jgi:TPR repeat protein